jgi:hypothetical protein
VALFTGQLTIGAVSTEGVGTPLVTSMVSPIELKGTLTCVGLPLSSITVDLKDYVKYLLDPPADINGFKMGLLMELE